MDIETVGERGVELGQGRIRGGEDEEGSEGRGCEGSKESEEYGSDSECGERRR